MNTLLLQNKQDNLFDIPEEYKKDVISIYEIQKYSKNLKFYIENTKIIENHMQLIDLSNIKNELLKNELQYCVYIITTEDIAFSTYSRNIRLFKIYVLEFLNKSSYESILNDSIIQQYEEYLVNNNKKLIENSRIGISAKMEEIQYTSSSREVLIFKKCQNAIKCYIEKDLKEFDKDIWHFDNLNFKVTNNPATPLKSISFEEILQPQMKITIKELVYEKLKVSPIKTSKEIVKHIKKFTNWLYLNKKDIENFSQLNRKIIEEYMAYVRTNKDFTSQHQYTLISSLKSFFDQCMLYQLKNTPKNILMTNKDFNWKKQIIVKFYTDEEIQNMNEHIGKLPSQYGRMLFILENIGMRNSDVCCLLPDCLSQNKKGDYYLNYFQVKTKQNNYIPINEVVAQVIIAGYEESKLKFGDDVKYVFAKSKDEPISSRTFAEALNQWSYDNKILDKTGNPLRIHVNKFRGTVATKYINLGLDIDIVRKMIGHSSKKAIYHYIEIHNETVLKAMKPIIDIQEQMISNIGNIKEVQNDILQNNEYIQLSNGMCCKPINEGVCKHANACLTCKMFKYDKSYLPLYENQLNEVNINIEIAKTNGFERILDYNLELKKNLEKIIKSIKGE